LPDRLPVAHLHPTPAAGCRGLKGYRRFRLDRKPLTSGQRGSETVSSSVPSVALADWRLILTGRPIAFSLSKTLVVIRGCRSTTFTSTRKTMKSVVSGVGQKQTIHLESRRRSITLPQAGQRTARGQLKTLPLLKRYLANVQAAFTSCLATVPSDY